jgi:phospholipase C
LVRYISQQTQEGEMGGSPARIRREPKRRLFRCAAIAAAAVTGAGVAVGATAGGANAVPHAASSVAVPAGSYLFGPPTATPIKHVVVIFDENVNQIEESEYWKSTAIVVTYDDSDGWYDHQPSVIVNGSNTSADAAICTSAPMVLGSYPDRCGYSQRLPMVVISPWTRENFVSHNLTSTVSILRFIEDNWLRGHRIGDGSYDVISRSIAGLGGLLDFFTFPHFKPVILNPATGEVVSS